MVDHAIALVGGVVGGVIAAIVLWDRQWEAEDRDKRTPRHA